MKALQITGKDAYQIIDLPLAEPREDQVTVKIEIASTCPRWDMSMMGGKDMFDAAKQPDYPLLPGFPGHEIAGTVVAVGSGIRALKVGDRVASLEHLEGNGAYAEYLHYREHELIKLPDEVEWKQAVSFELLKCVLIGLLQFGDLAGKSMLVSGLGPAGMLAMQAARLLGATKVTAIDINRERIELVNGLGLGLAKHVDDLGEERFDLGYDCVGASASVQGLLERIDSHLVIFGVLKGEVRYGEHLWFKGIRLESYRYRKFDEQDQALLLDLVVNKGLNTDCLQTHHVPFYRYRETIELLNKQEAIKVYAYPPTDFVDAAEGSRNES
ncbi:alcohol dehydrogenase catalytic domain-containing protein [Paenibacillus sp. J5C_2022]|uniref:zinc-dependent alcohol dehydrogenase n=1 Tax=Paenibacillus sp. J5C2022 TaxID=2977129 RepID=UPI0021CF11D8|nr:alcohol dehydrogenase catalytic domain-containing protein [Paenibacillus sp. J5C2022]MCU6711357.1 alcohol dehydrogenase catalytic domain-containing protein [Paenibacillus sp. J5C2022]